MPIGRKMRTVSQYDEWKAEDTKGEGTDTRKDRLARQRAGLPAFASEEATPTAPPSPAAPQHVRVPTTPRSVRLEPEAEVVLQHTHCLAVVAAHSVRVLTAAGRDVCSCILKDDGEVVSVCFDRSTSFVSSYDHIQTYVLTSVGTIWVYSLPTSGHHEEDLAEDRKWLHTADLGVCCMARLLCTSQFTPQQKPPPGTPKKVATSAVVAGGGSGGALPAGSKFVLAGTTDGRVLVLNHTGSGELVRTQKCHRWPIRQVEWLEAQQRIVTVSKDECAVLDDRALTALRTISLGEEQSPMLGCTLVASNGVILTPDVENHTIWMCDALGVGKHEHMDVLGPAHPDAIVSIDYNPDRDLFLTASVDGNVKVLSGASWSVLRDVNLGRSLQTACFLNAKGDIVVATELSVALVPASSAYVSEKTQSLREAVLGPSEPETSRDPFRSVDNAGKPPSVVSLTQEVLERKHEVRASWTEEAEAQAKQALHAPGRKSKFGMATSRRETVLLSTSTLGVLKSPRLGTSASIGLTARATSAGGVARSGGATGRDSSLFASTAIFQPTTSFLRNVVPGSSSPTRRPEPPQTLTGFLQTASWFTSTQVCSLSRFSESLRRCVVSVYVSAPRLPRRSSCSRTLSRSMSPARRRELCRLVH